MKKKSVKWLSAPSKIKRKPYNLNPFKLSWQRLMQIQRYKYLVLCLHLIIIKLNYLVDGRFRVGIVKN